MVAILSATDKNSNIAISGGSLVATDGGGAVNHAGRGDTATTVIGAGIKRYFEVRPTSLSTGFGVGAANSSNTFADADYLGGQANSIAWFADGSVFFNGAPTTSAATYTGTDVLGVAVDGGNKIWFSVNGTFTGNPGAGTGGTAIGVTGDVYPGYNLQGGGVATFNFGATTFNTAAPSGFSGFDTSGDTLMGQMVM